MREGILSHDGEPERGDECQLVLDGIAEAGVEGKVHTFQIVD
jgi:hypothetical protein